MSAEKRDKLEGIGYVPHKRRKYAKKLGDAEFLRLLADYRDKNGGQDPIALYVTAEGVKLGKLLNDMRYKFFNNKYSEKKQLWCIEHGVIQGGHCEKNM